MARQLFTQPRPTAAQRRMIESGLRHPLQSTTGDMFAAYLHGYTDATVAVAEASGWVEVDRDNALYRVLPAGAWAIGQCSAAIEIERLRALATDPRAQRAVQLVALGRAVGIQVDADPSTPERVSLSPEDLERLLATFRRSGPLVTTR